MVVHAHRWSNPFHAGGKESWVQEWREGMTVGDVFPDDVDGYFLVNGARVSRDQRVWPGNHVDAVRRPGPQAIPFIINVLIAVTASLIVRSLTPKPRSPIRRGDEDADASPTYGFSGIDNVRVEGQPRQAVFGKIMLGGTIINEFVRVVDGEVPTSDYYALIAFGEGPIRSIAGVTSDTVTPLTSVDGDVPLGILINGNELQNLAEAEVHVRLGTLEQAVVPGFEKSRTIIAVSLGLSQAEGNPLDFNSDAIDTVSTADYNDPANESIWTDFAGVYSLTDDADSAIVTINFPGGLYHIDSNADLQFSRFTMLVRYIELDGGGSPITTGGDNNDGYVYLFPHLGVWRRIQSSFDVEYEVPFFDPQTWTAPTPGGQIIFNGAGAPPYDGRATIAGTQTLPAAFGPAGQPEEMTWEGWVRYNVELPNTLITRTIFEWSDSSGNGFAVVAHRRYYNSEGGFRTVLTVIVGSEEILLGDQGESHAHTETTNDKWTHFAVVYKRAGFGSSSRKWRIYIDGALRLQPSHGILGGDVVLVGHADNLWFGGPNATSGVNYARGGHDWGTAWRLDEVNWYSRALSTAEISLRHGGGFGNQGTGDPDLMAGWHGDDVAGVGSPPQNQTSDYSGNGNDIVGAPDQLGFSAAVTVGALVRNTSPGDPKRSRYKVECLRTNLQSNSERFQDESVWSFITPEVDEAFSHPHTPLLGLKVRASEQLNTNRPNVKTLVEGLLVPVWDGQDIFNPAAPPAYSQNPAWQALKILTDRFFGLGDVYPIHKIDMLSLQDVADEADAFVYDGLQRTLGGDNDAIPTGDPQRGTWIDLDFDDFAPANDDRGLLTIRFHNNTGTASDTRPPTHWEVGDYVAFDGLPGPNDDSGIFADLNFDEIGAFEIRALEFSSSVGGFIAELYWDRTAIPVPWSGAVTPGNLFLAASVTLTELAATHRVFRVERRFQFNGVFDTFGASWDKLVELLQVARAYPIRDGDRVRFRAERARAAVAMLTSASVVRDGGKSTFEYQFASNADRPNVYSVDFLDRDLNYERSNEPVRHPDVDATTFPDEMIERPIFLLGFTSRPAVIRHARFLLEVNKQIRVTGRCRCFANAVAWEPGDRVVVAHDLLPWGTGGRFLAGTTGSTVKLDREVVIESGKSYSIISDNPSTRLAETVPVSSGAGTYAAGDSITLTGGFSFVPLEDAEYVFAEDGTERSVVITGWRVLPDMTVDVEWHEYVESIYDVDLALADADYPLVTGGDGPPYEATPATLLPSNATNVAVHAMPVRGGGALVPRLAATWELGANPERVHGVRLWRKINDAAWEMVAVGRGPERSLSWQEPRLSSGDEIRVAVAPVSESGASRRPDLCSQSVFTWNELGGAPAAPTSPAARLDNDLVVYSWTVQAGGEPSNVELRSGGGWILAQKIAESEPGASRTEPGTGWVEVASTPPILLRSRDQLNRYSDEYAELSFAPTPDETEILDPRHSDSYPDQAWHSFGDGWVYDTSPPASNATLTDLARAADGTLAFSGAALSGQYQTANWSVVGFERGERCYVSAALVAYQVHPRTLEEWGPLGSPFEERWTLEGPLWTLPSEPANCTALIEISILTAVSAKGGGSWTAFRPYQPGIYFGIAFRFRVTFTRPDTTYDVRVDEFSTRCRRIPKQRHEYSPLERYLQRRMMR